MCRANLKPSCQAWMKPKSQRRTHLIRKLINSICKGDFTLTKERRMTCFTALNSTSRQLVSIQISRLHTWPSLTRTRSCRRTVMPRQTKFFRKQRRPRSGQSKSIPIRPRHMQRTEKYSLITIGSGPRLSANTNDQSNSIRMLP